MRKKTYTLGKRLGYINKINCTFYKTKKAIIENNDISMYQLNLELNEDIVEPGKNDGINYHFVEIKEGEYHGKTPISEDDYVFPMGKLYGQSIIDCKDWQYMNWIINATDFSYPRLQEIIEMYFGKELLKHNTLKIN
jgi:hypothetical protein